VTSTRNRPSVFAVAVLLSPSPAAAVLPSAFAVAVLLSPRNVAAMLSSPVAAAEQAKLN
jgi:hypothetical protein